jgi:hypothetical protein
MDDGHPLIDPHELAQLAEIRPKKETVVTWTAFRVLVGALEGTGESVLEMRSMDGAEVHQWVLGDDARATIVKALMQQMDPADRLIIP